jgi:hypothetical protein
VTWAAERRRWLAGVGDGNDIAGGGGRADGREDDAGRVETRRWPAVLATSSIRYNVMRH